MKTALLSPAPIALLTSEPVVTAKELTITKKTADTLRVILEMANSVLPKCSTATKNKGNYIQSYSLKPLKGYKFSN